MTPTAILESALYVTDLAEADAILALLYVHTGIDFSIYERRRLMHRIVHRMQVVGAAELERR